MSQDESNYYGRRADDELRMMENATDARAAAVHRALARAYRTKANAWTRPSAYRGLNA